MLYINTVNKREIMFNYFCAKLGRYGERVVPRNFENASQNSLKLYKKTTKNDVEVFTSFVDKKPFRRVSILNLEENSIYSPIKKRAVLKEDFVTGNKTQINTDVYLNTISHKKEFPEGRLQFSVSKVTVDKNGEPIEAKRDAYYKSPDGKSWVHYISNDKPVIYDWKSWQG